MSRFKVSFRLKRTVPDVDPRIVYVQTFSEERTFVELPAWEWLRKHRNAFDDTEILSIEAVE